MNYGWLFLATRTAVLIGVVPIGVSSTGQCGCHCSYFFELHDQSLNRQIACHFGSMLASFNELPGYEARSILSMLLISHSIYGAVRFYALAMTSAHCMVKRTEPTKRDTFC